MPNTAKTEWPQIALPGGSPSAKLYYFPAWLEATLASDFQEQLMEQVAWQSHTIRLFGRDCLEPRLSCWVGDSGLDYRYSGRKREAKPWTPGLMAIRQRLKQQLALDFNTVLVNRYRDGQDSMGWHSDDEPELGEQPLIASLSLGETRRFSLRKRRERQCKHTMLLSHGDLLIMAGGLQQEWQHALPKTAKVIGERLNLTFRQFIPAEC